MFEDDVKKCYPAEARAMATAVWFDFQFSPFFSFASIVTDTPMEVALTAWPPPPRVR